MDSSGNNEQNNFERFWRRCSSCKAPIPYNKKFYVCSVSTCSEAKTSYTFCSVACFERHLPIARHRTAGAIEKMSPKESLVSDPSKSGIQLKSESREVLVIASRLKDYVQNTSGFNTSGAVMDVLSDFMRILCDRAIENARAEGRKTILDRDFDFLKGHNKN